MGAIIFPPFSANRDDVNNPAIVCRSVVYMGSYKAVFLTAPLQGRDIPCLLVWSVEQHKKESKERTE